MIIDAADRSMGKVIRFQYLLLAAALLFGGSSLARDLTTNNGDVFKNISVRSKDPTGVNIMHDDGVAFLDFKSLSATDQKDFGYDPAAYANAVDQKYEAAKLRREQAHLAALQVIASAQAQTAQANAWAQEILQRTNRTNIQVNVASPDFIYGGSPACDSTDVIAFGNGRSFGMTHNIMTGSSAGIRRR